MPKDEWLKAKNREISRRAEHDPERKRAERLDAAADAWIAGRERALALKKRRRRKRKRS
jgi:hypothetical protein